MVEDPRDVDPRWCPLQYVEVAMAESCCVRDMKEEYSP
jgi:hypothetical protein